MPVNQQIAIRTVLVLTNSRLDQRPIRQRRKSSLHVLAHSREDLRTRHTITAIGINRLPMPIMRDLHSARLQIRGPVKDVSIIEVRPAGKLSRQKTRVARLGCKEEHLLPRRKNPLAEYFRKYLRQPRSAGEHEARRAQRCAVDGANRVE